MFTQRYLPHPTLQPFVRFYMFQQAHIPKEVHCILSCKVMSALLFAFKTPAITSLNFHNKLMQDKVYLGEKPAMIGPNTTFANAYFEGEINMIAVALQSTGAYHFLKESANVLINKGLKIELVTKQFNEVQEKLLTVDTAVEAIHLLEPYLYRYFTRNNPAKKNISGIINDIDQRQGLVNVDVLSKKFRISERWIEKQFQEQIGINPKAYIRATRFRNMLHQLYHSPSLSWLDLVTKFNYTDQSHLIKDFHQYTGNSPLSHFQNLPFIDQNILRKF